MDAVVQLIRNGLCCIKDLGWFQETLPVLWDNEVLLAYYELPEPMNQTTLLEFMIGVTQFYAVVSLCSSGWRLVHTSYGKLIRVQRILDAQTDDDDEDDDDDKDKDEKKSKQTKKYTDAERLVKASLVKEGMYALRSIFIGFVIFCIGLSFFWLCAHSFHVTEAGWIGGAQGLIHALTVAEAGLLPLLYYMWKDAGEQFKKASRMEEMAKQMHALRGSRLNSADIDLASFEALTSWLPFWDSGLSIFGMQVPEAQIEEKLVNAERMKVQRSLEEYVGTSSSSGKEKKVNVAFMDDKARELLGTSRLVRLEGYREMIFFVLNAIAFYGYMFCVLAFYYEEEASKPSYLQLVMFNLDSVSADWYGNFYGDLMWTIEPIVLLSSLVMFSSMRAAQTKKEKTD